MTERAPKMPEKKRAPNSFSPNAVMPAAKKPVAEDGLVEADVAVEARDKEIAGTEHLAGGLGESRLVAVPEGSAGVADPVEGEGGGHEEGEAERFAAPRARGQVRRGRRFVSA